MKSLKNHPSTRVLLAAVPLAIMVSGCSSSQRRCQPTVMRAREAAAVDTQDSARGMRLDATLATYKGAPVRDRVIHMAMLYRRPGGHATWQQTGEPRTGRSGRASDDAANDGPSETAARALADRWRAVWTGDARYCSSSAEAAFRAAKVAAPRRVSVPHVSPIPAPEVVEAPPVPRTPVAVCKPVEVSVPRLPTVRAEVCVP